MRWWVVALVVMGGCARAHVACEGPDLEREYRLVFAATDAQGCPTGGAARLLPGDEWCEVDATCDTIAAVRCDTEASGVSFVATVDLDWTSTEAAGGATIVWLDNTGAETCVGEYDVSMRAP